MERGWRYKQARYVRQRPEGIGARIDCQAIPEAEVAP